jgi:hypothetical protein
VILLGFERQKYFFSFSFFFFFFFFLLSRWYFLSSHTIYCRTLYMIYMFGFVTSAELPSIYVALWWAATILLRLLICIVCWLPLSHQRLSAKSQSSSDEAISRVSRLIHLYYGHTHTHSGGEQTKPSDIVYFDSSQRTILFLPVCAIHKLRYSIHCLSFDCVMRQFVLYHLIKAPALFLMCLLLYV